MLKRNSDLPRASGLFGVWSKFQTEIGAPANDKDLPDIESFEANYARQLLKRAVMFTAGNRDDDDFVI